MRITRDTVYLLILGAASSLVVVSEAFCNIFVSPKSLSSRSATQISVVQNPSDAFGNLNVPQKGSRFCKARELIKSLVEEEKCFSTEAGAREFGEVCAINIVYEDCFEPQPMVGKTVRGNICSTVPSNLICR
jgi:hypothetical protein